MRRLLLICLVLALPLGCETASDTGDTKGIPDSQIGLSKSSVFDVHAPVEVTWAETRPGTNEKIPRAHPESPPVVPHGITEMLPITQEDNVCVDCHADRSAKPTGPLMTPTHFTDLRQPKAKAGKEVVGARWLCVSCHVPQSDAVPLVKTR